MPLFQQFSYILNLIDEAVETQLPVYQTEVSSLKALEAQFGLFQLKQVLLSAKNANLAIVLKNFLKHRWSSIKNTDIQYNQDFENPLNQICIKISKTLSRLIQVPSLALLMPTLKQIPIENYITSDYADESLDLKKIVLSDNARVIIHIEDVLDFAISDGCLKHHVTIGGKVNELSLAEIHRVLSRHSSVSLLYDAITDKVQHELYGETAGAYLKRLINGLTLGNVEHHGTECEAGEAAYVAVSEFQEFLNILDRATRKKIMDSSSLYESFSESRGRAYKVKDCWKRLCHHVGLSENLGTYCVKIIGSELDDILVANPELYQMTAFHDEHLVSLKTLVERIDEVKMLMKADFSKPMKRHIAYGEQAEQKILEYLAEKIQKNTQFQLNSSAIVLFAHTLYEQVDQGNVSFVENCRKILANIHQHYPKQMIMQATSTMTPPVKELFLQQRPGCQSDMQSLFSPHKKIRLSQEKIKQSEFYHGFSV